jgi:hypothetical protein
MLIATLTPATVPAGFVVGLPRALDDTAQSVTITVLDAAK